MELSKEQKQEYEYLNFLYDESQIDDREYKTKLIELVGEENVTEYKMLTGMYPGHTINVIELKNYSEEIQKDEEYDGQNEFETELIKKLETKCKVLTEKYNAEFEVNIGEPIIVDDIEVPRGYYKTEIIALGISKEKICEIVSNEFESFENIIIDCSEFNNNNTSNENGISLKQTFKIY